MSTRWNRSKEYALPGNVPSYVIDDIAGWLTGKN